MTVEEYIENECFVVVNPDYPVISKENALKAVEISVYEERQKAIEAYKKSCDFNAPGCCGCKNSKGECDCEQLKDFITELTNN